MGPLPSGSVGPATPRPAFAEERKRDQLRLGVEQGDVGEIGRERVLEQAAREVDEGVDAGLSYERLADPAHRLELSLMPNRLADVDQEALEMLEPGVLVGHDDDLVPHPERTAVRVDDPVAERGATAAIRECRGAFGQDSLPVIRMDEACEEGVFEPLFGRETEHRLDLRAHIGEGRELAGPIGVERQRQVLDHPPEGVGLSLLRARLVVGPVSWRTHERVSVRGRSRGCNGENARLGTRTVRRPSEQRLHEFL